MVTHKVAVVPGDGIGPEVLAEGKRCWRKSLNWMERFSLTLRDFPWGCGVLFKEWTHDGEDGIEPAVKIRCDLPWRS